MMKWILAFVVLVGIAFGLGYYYRQSSTLGELTYELKNITINNEHGYKIDAQYPVITGGVSRPVREIINKRIVDFTNDDITRVKGEFDSMVKDFGDTRESLGLSYLGKVTLVSDFKSLPFLNIKSEVYYYAGGAHGISIDTVFVFDARTGGTVSLKDVFQGEYLKVLSRLSLDALKDKDPKLQTYSFAEDGTAPDYENFKIFSLESDGMHIKFSDYQVGPHVAGRPEIVIPYSKLKEVINDNMRESLLL